MADSKYELEELAQLMRQEVNDKGNLGEILIRSDLVSLLCCADGIVRDPIGLFWSLYEPRSFRPKRGPAPELSEEWEEIVLASLERLYISHQVPYEPDGAVFTENDFQYSLDSGYLIVPDILRDLITFLHIAAARAFRLKQRQGGGLSEEVISCLVEVVRANNRLYQAGLGDLLNCGSSHMFMLSADTVSAKACVEIGRVRYAEGRYDEALRYMSRAAFESHYAAERYSEHGDDAGYSTESERIPMAPSCSLTDPLVRRGLGNVSPEDITSIFLALKERGQANSWSEVVKDCKNLFYSTYMFGMQDNTYTRFADGESERVTEWVMNEPPWVRDEFGEALTWGEFWHGAWTWASAQLSPSEYRKMREEDEKSTSESRLKSYFFGQDWSALSDRAKERLITADVLWNSPANIAWEALLSDLRIAAEDMCYRFIWEPVSSVKGGGQGLLQFVRLKDELDRDEKRPEIGICVQVCRAGYFRDFLNRQSLDKEDIEFLTKKLPSAMSQLQEARNFGEHQSTGSWSRDAVGIYYRQFFGIGQRGILPELARIGRQLRRS